MADSTQSTAPSPTTSDLAVPQTTKATTQSNTSSDGLTPSTTFQNAPTTTPPQHRASSGSATILIVVATAALLVVIGIIFYCRRRMMSMKRRSNNGSRTSEDPVMPLFTLTRAMSQSKLDSESSFVFLDAGRADIVLHDHAVKCDQVETELPVATGFMNMKSVRGEPLEKQLSYIEQSSSSDSKAPQRVVVHTLPILDRSSVVVLSCLAIGGSMWTCKFEGRPAVVKRVQPAEMTTAEMDTFIADVNLIAQLVHPHIVKLHGIVHMADDVCVVAEYMERGSLGVVLHQKSLALSWAHQLRLCWQVVSALSFVHSQSHYLRVKPWTTRSVLVDALLSAKLNVFDHMTNFRRDGKHEVALNLSFGKQVMAYEAPEVIFHDCARSSSGDIYSLGVILAEIATRRLPYQSWVEQDGYIGCDVRISENNPANLPHEGSAAFKATPVEFQRLVTACLNRDVLKRPLALNVAEDLQRLLDEAENA
ncbi:hypothetical protein AC1031_002837 [Aphanomyces cochlioides]|nr:hypothetical protein AC1031_002837 [Aphanomyces cochlioides]